MTSPAFTSNQQITQVTYRTDTWAYDPKGNTSQPDFRVEGRHDQGATPFGAVNLEVHVKGRMSNEHFQLSKRDAEALRDMFAEIVNNMA
tara:strand:+ start:339 stop:605 length:267 start_codon:yes stop_codon:yes gene_type:complete